MSLTESVRYIIDADDRASAKVRKHNSLLKSLVKETNRQESRTVSAGKRIVESSKTELQRIREKIDAVRAYGRTSGKAFTEAQGALSELIKKHKEVQASIKKQSEAHVEETDAIADKAEEIKGLAAVVGATTGGIALAVAALAVQLRESITVDFAGIESTKRQQALNKALEKRNKLNQEGIEKASGKETFEKELSELTRLLELEKERTRELKARADDVPNQVGRETLIGETEGIDDVNTLSLAVQRAQKQNSEATEELEDSIKSLKARQAGALDDFNLQLKVAKAELAGNTEEARRLELQSQKTFTSDQIDEVIKKEGELKRLRADQDFSASVQQLKLQAATASGNLALAEKITNEIQQQADAAKNLTPEQQAQAAALREQVKEATQLAKFDQASDGLAMQIAKLKGNESLIKQLQREADIRSGLTPEQADQLALQREQLAVAKEQETAASKRLAEEQKLAGVYSTNVNSLKEQLIGVTQSKAAAEAFKLEMQGVGKQDAVFLGGLKERVKSLQEASKKSTVNVGNNTAADDRLSNGRAESTFQKTAEAIEAERQTKIQETMKTYLGQLVEFERRRKEQPLVVVGK